MKLTATYPFLQVCPDYKVVPAAPLAPPEHERILDYPNTVDVPSAAFNEASVQTLQVFAADKKYPTVYPLAAVQVTEESVTVKAVVSSVASFAETILQVA